MEVYHNNADFDQNHAHNLKNSIVITNEVVTQESLIIKIIDFE